MKIRQHKDTILKMLLEPKEWNSMVVNLREPHTYRAWRMLDETHRLCVHRFEPCKEGDAFYHCHPWSGEFLVLSGGYFMKVGYAESKMGDEAAKVWGEPRQVMTTFMAADSWYEINTPNTFHHVQPVTSTYSIMINGAPWDKDYAHPSAPTTKGKDLGRMKEGDLEGHLTDVYYLFKLWTRSLTCERCGR